MASIKNHISTDIIKRCVKLTDLYTQLVCWGILPVKRNREEDLVDFIRTYFYGDTTNVELNLKHKMERVLRTRNDEK